MINKRYKNDGISILNLNKDQEKIKNQIKKRINLKTYKFESVPCVLCKNDHFTKLSDKDRYGFHTSVVMCSKCGLVQTNPRMNQESYDRFYNEEYRILYNLNKESETDFFSRRYIKGKEIFNYLFRYKTLNKIPSSCRVLEIGCSSGGILKVFKEKGYLVKGYDLDRNFINFGRDHYNLDLNVGTILDVDAGFKPDIIIYSHVLEHVLDLDKELTILKDMLADDGILYVEAPGIKNLKESYSLDFLKYLQNAHTYHFTLKSLTNLLKNYGFKLFEGDNFIRSIYKKSEEIAGKNTKSDYSNTIFFLYRIEHLRVFYLLRFFLKFFILNFRNRNIHEIIVEGWKEFKAIILR